MPIFIWFVSNNSLQKLACSGDRPYISSMRNVFLPNGGGFKGNGWVEILPNLWPLLIFLFVVGSIALLRYRETLD